MTEARTAPGSPPEAPPPLRVAPFWFVRHGETDWNREGRLQGQKDIAMNPRGRDQASASGRTLAGLLGERRLGAETVDFVASPLGRTRQTMQLMRAAMGLNVDVYRMEPRLRELSFGTWEGMTWPEIKRQDPGRYAGRRADKWGFVAPGGESYAELMERIRPVVTSLPPEAVVVSHGGVARALMVLLTGLDREAAPAAEIWQGRVLRFEHGGFTWF